MKSLKKSILWTIVCSVTLSILMFSFPTTAKADSSMSMKPIEDAIVRIIQIKNGKFELKIPSADIPVIPVHSDLTVRSAVVTLPASETGTLEKIIITGPTGEREFGCFNIKIKNGSDLIKSCGGPAVLKAGNTTYEAKGSDFSPQADVEFAVSLRPDFLAQKN